MVQEVILDLLVGQVEEIKATDKGLFEGKQILELAFGPEADLSGATLRLQGAEKEDWASYIGRVQSGEIAKEREPGPRKRKWVRLHSQRLLVAPTVVPRLRSLWCAACVRSHASTATS